MRIIGGIYGSRRIKANIPSNVRPTSDKVRESMFNSIHNLIDIENSNVLDLFAGTGALGFEALSRGAKYCCFVEINRKTTEIIRSVATELSISKSQFKIINSDAIKYLNKDIEDTKYDIIFADPPYEASVYSSIFESLSTTKILSDNGIIIIEYRSNMKVPINTQMELITKKEFGDTSYDIYELACH